MYIQSDNSKGFAPWNLIHKIPVFLDPGGFVKFEPQARTFGKCWESFNCLLLIVDLENVELFFTLGHPGGSGRRGCVASLRCAGSALMMWFAVTRSPRSGALEPPRCCINLNGAHCIEGVHFQMSIHINGSTFYGSYFSKCVEPELHKFTLFSIFTKPAKGCHFVVGMDFHLFKFKTMLQLIDSRNYR